MGKPGRSPVQPAFFLKIAVVFRGAVPHFLIDGLDGPEPEMIREFEFSRFVLAECAVECADDLVHAVFLAGFQVGDIHRLGQPPIAQSSDASESPTDGRRLHVFQCILEPESGIPRGGDDDGVFTEVSGPMKDISEAIDERLHEIGDVQ